MWAFLDNSQRDAVTEMLSSNSDRIIAVLGGAILDNTLRRTLEERLRDSGVNEVLFRAGGPLGNTVPKIDLGYLLYAFEKAERNVMYGIAEIRNHFAHHLNAHFDSKELDGSFKKLTLHNRAFFPLAAKKTGKKIPMEKASTKRDVFVVNLKVSLIVLMGDRLRHKLHSSEPLKTPAPIYMQREKMPTRRP